MMMPQACPVINMLVISSWNNVVTLVLDDDVLDKSLA